MRISVIIPNYNGERFLGPCLDSLLAQTRRAERVIVVDNGSEDNSREVVARHPLAPELIPLERNLGFAGAVARGVLATDTEVVALLNNDAVADPRWVEMGLRGFQVHPEVTMLASLILQAEARDLVDNAGDLYPRDGRPRPRGRGEKATGFSEKVEVLSPCGAAAFYRREVFSTAGNFEESFFAYLEDVDLGLSARARGHLCLFFPAAVVYHLGAGTALQDRAGKKPEDSSQRVYWIARNRVRLLARHWPARSLFCWSPWLLLGFARSAFYHLFFSGQFLYFLRGLGEGVKHWSKDRKIFYQHAVDSVAQSREKNFSPHAGFAGIAKMMKKGTRSWEA